ncbi:MATE family efflux transporter [Bacillus sp. M6-12]|uniref:MATE family efflux transporter n=1 Tax=Bacillus sp. M6-12 TaxID=2054166 RepID=UPI000C766018|nr:MATE family efflux transporter [Bacillus sp. M6-12]PLS15343.1 MATE family efflux transporter [Bacillus sp. M6-12]
MNQHDFTRGNLWEQMVRFSTPILLTNLLQVSYQFIDSLWVGNLLGANALGAVSVSGTVIFTILSFIIGVNNAALTILSQQKGKADRQGLTNYLNAFVVILTILSLLLGVLGYIFSEWILVFLGTPEAMISSAEVFLKINFVGIIFLFGYNFIATILRSIGDSKTPLTFVFLSVVLNTFLVPLFIIYFGMGIEGAALATIISQGVAFLFGLSLVIRRKIVPFSVPYLPKKEEAALIFKLGIPAGLQMTVISAGVMAIMSVVNSFGADVVAGFGAAQRIDSLIMLPAMALSTAVNSMAGQNIGAGRWDRVHKIAVYGVLYNLSIMVAVAVVIFLFSELGIGLFIQEQEAREFGGQYLRIVAFFYPFLGINFILNGIVRGSGAMFQVLILNIISFWILRYPLTYLFSLNLGEAGIGLGMGTAFVIGSLTSYLYYRYGKWKKEILPGKE